MQDIRGFVHFEGRTFDKINLAFINFSLGSTRFGYFRSLLRYGNLIREPGIFLTGQVDRNYSSAEIVNLLRDRLSLKKELRGCDISIESEDTIIPLMEGGLIGNYSGIRIKPPYSIGEASTLALNLGELVKAHNILVRTVESEEGKPLVCIDLITKQEFDKHLAEIERMVSSTNLSLGGYTFISLEI